jgi:zinc transport system ATP-binding protein
VASNTTMDTPVIAIEGLSFSYDGSPVLEDVNLTVREHDYACIVGPNGGGKTTLLKLILGLLRPTRGSVRVFGGSPEESRPRIGYMPQHAQLDPQFPVSVLDVVLMGRLGNGRRLGPFRKADKDLAAEALREVGLDPVRRRPFSALSGGQRQRVLIARALACQPELLLFDEPTSNLDLRVHHDLYELLGELNRRLTVILVSHDVGVVSQFVKSVICVNCKVHVHPTTELTGEVLSEVYGGDVRMVRHDLHGVEGGHL